MNDVMIKVNNLSKRFKIYSNPWLRALEWANFGRETYHQDFWALQGISFEVKKGECLGIIGPNGAGKSTLLKILTRSLYPTSGTFQINGSVLSLLELGTGFNPELTGRQNIFRSSQLLGFPKAYVSERIQDIEDFAEIGEFFDRAIKTYSSGMYVRLAFSMFVFLKPEVLIVDEALSVGDIFFQQKCFGTMRETISHGTTCLFVSHDVAAIINLCHRTILLNDGKMDSIGSPEIIVNRYFSQIGHRSSPKGMTRSKEESLSSKQEDMLPPNEILKRNIIPPKRVYPGAGGMRILGARITDSKGNDTLQVQMKEALFFHILIRANEDIPEPNIGVSLYDRLGNLIFSTGTTQQGKQLPSFRKDNETIVALRITFTVSPGQYTFSLFAGEPSHEPNPNIGYMHDWIDQLGPLSVIFDPTKLLPFYGMASLPVEIHYITP